MHDVLLYFADLAFEGEVKSQEQAPTQQRPTVRQDVASEDVERIMEVTERQQKEHIMQLQRAASRVE